MTFKQLPAEVTISTETGAMASVAADFRYMTRESSVRIQQIARKEFGIEENLDDPLYFIGDLLIPFIGGGLIQQYGVRENTIVVPLQKDIANPAKVVRLLKDFLNSRFELRVQEQPTGPQARELQPAGRSSEPFSNHHGGLRP